MNEDVKAYLIVIGAFIVSIVSFVWTMLYKYKTYKKRLKSGL